MTKDLREDLDDRLQAIIIHVASLQELIRQPGDWVELIQRAETLEEDADALKDLIMQNSPQHKEMVKKYGEF